MDGMTIVKSAIEEGPGPSDMRCHGQHVETFVRVLSRVWGVCCLNADAVDYFTSSLILMHHMQVLKVLHGADSDIVWLQRDFGIYVTNLFDTGQAARVLGYPSAGLAYLLSRFCRVKVMLVRPSLPMWSDRCAASTNRRMPLPGLSSQSP